MAREYTAPGVQAVCCDANDPLPFARGLASMVMLSDAFPYIWKRRLLAEEERHEGHHSRVDEQQVGVGQDQRGAGYFGVAGLHEVVEKASADLVGLHVMVLRVGRCDVCPRWGRRLRRIGRRSAYRDFRRCRPSPSTGTRVPSERSTHYCL